MKVVFSDQDIFRDYAPYLDCIKPLAEKAEIAAYDESPCGDEERYERLRDADVVVFAVHKMDTALLERLGKLKMLQFMGVGHTTFADPEYCERAGVIFKNAENYGSNAVAEYTIAHAFTLARNTAKADRYMRGGKWIYDGLEGIEIAGSTFGLVGTGNIGRLVAEKAHALGADVTAYDVYEDEGLKSSGKVRYVCLEELFRSSDVISVHAKYLPETAGMVTRELIGMMKPTALFVNTARAEIVDYDALFDALESGAIAGAALDVYYEEPMRDFSLCGHPNVVTSPHIGFFTGKAKGNCLRTCVESIMTNMRL